MALRAAQIGVSALNYLSIKETANAARGVTCEVLPDLTMSEDTLNVATREELEQLYLYLELREGKCGDHGVKKQGVGQDF